MSDILRYEPRLVAICLNDPFIINDAASKLSFELFLLAAASVDDGLLKQNFKLHGAPYSDFHRATFSVGVDSIPVLQPTRHVDTATCCYIIREHNAGLIQRVPSLPQII